jgi:hypothetical protein
MLLFLFRTVLPMATQEVVEKACPGSVLNLNVVLEPMIQPLDF